jgi:hypothetical protein
MVGTQTAWEEQRKCLGYEEVMSALWNVSLLAEISSRSPLPDWPPALSDNVPENVETIS